MNQRTNIPSDSIAKPISSRSCRWLGTPVKARVLWVVTGTGTVMTVGGTVPGETTGGVTTVEVAGTVVQSGLVALWQPVTSAVLVNDDPAAGA